MTSLEVALDYHAKGLFVLPIKLDGTKSPSAETWEFYKERRPTIMEIHAWFAQSRGIAVVCGPCSCQLEVIDFEKESTFMEWKELADQLLPGVVNSCVLVKTPGSKHHGEDGSVLPGIHVYYHIDTFDAPKCEKLAKDREGQLLIKVKGAGGYVVVPGGDERAHPSGKPYHFIKGTFDSIPKISAAEREALITLAASLNQFVVEIPEGRPESKGVSGDLPGHDYDAKGDWSVLEKHGWRMILNRGAFQGWRRPGKETAGISATTGYCKGRDGTDRLYVFSTNAKPFEDRRCYSRFAVFTFLEHQGDWSKASKALVEQGFGNKRKGADSPPLDMSELDRTDIGNAKKLVELHGQDMRYVHPWKKFIYWDTNRWREDDCGQIERHAKDVVRHLYVSASKTCLEATSNLMGTSPEQYSDDLLLKVKLQKKHAKQTGSHNRIKAMIALAASEPDIPLEPNQLDADPMVLNCLNGVVDLRSAALGEHHRDQLLSKLCPVVYDPDAKCPQFLNFLMQAMNDRREMVEYLQRALGYSFTASDSEHAVFINHGKGANGKTVFINAILHVLGNDYSMQGSSELLLASRSDRHPTEQADLFGRRFISISEIDEGRHLAEARLKQLTGGDKVRARRMHENFWQFDPTHKFWIATNHKPHIRGQDEGIWRRIQLIPWELTIPPEKRDRNLLSKLLQERVGILSWIVEGARQWSKQGLCPPQKVIDATQEYRCEQDALQAFIEEQCRTGKDYRVSSSILFDRFIEHAPQNKNVTTVDFARAMQNKGFEKKRSAVNGSMQWHGLTLGEGFGVDDREGSS